MDIVAFGSVDLSSLSSLFSIRSVIPPNSGCICPMWKPSLQTLQGLRLEWWLHCEPGGSRRLDSLPARYVIWLVPTNQIHYTKHISGHFVDDTAEVSEHQMPSFENEECKYAALTASPRLVWIINHFPFCQPFHRKCFHLYNKSIALRKGEMEHQPRPQVNYLSLN